MLVIVKLIFVAYWFYGMGATPPSASKLTENPSISFDEFLDNKIYAKRNNATWITNTELMYRDAAVSQQSDCRVFGD